MAINIVLEQTATPDIALIIGKLPGFIKLPYFLERKNYLSPKIDLPYIFANNNDQILDKFKGNKYLFCYNLEKGSRNESPHI